jgi:hypothetical protein
VASPQPVQLALRVRLPARGVAIALPRLPTCLLPEHSLAVALAALLVQVPVASPQLALPALALLVQVPVASPPLVQLALALRVHLLVRGVAIVLTRLPPCLLALAEQHPRVVRPRVVTTGAGLQAEPRCRKPALERASVPAQLFDRLQC